MLRVELPAGRFRLALALGGPQELIGILFDGHDGLIQVVLLVLQYLLGMLRGEAEAKVLTLVLVVIGEGIVKGRGPVFCHSMIIKKVYAKFINFIRRL